MFARLVVSIACVCFLVSIATSQQKEPLFTEEIDVNVPHISTDASVNYDYDIVYVRAPRAGDEVHKRFYLDFSSPVVMEPGADLMLLHPDGSEELRSARRSGGRRERSDGMEARPPVALVACQALA